MNSPKHLGYWKKENAYLLRRAIKHSGFKVEIRKPTEPENEDCVSVFTHESQERDHGPFWREYERLKAKWDNGNWLTRLLMSLFG